MSLKHDLTLCFVKLVRARLCMGLAVAPGLPSHAALPTARPAQCSGVLLPASKPSLPDMGELGSRAGDAPLPHLGSSGREENWRQSPRPGLCGR